MIYYIFTKNIHSFGLIMLSRYFGGIAFKESTYMKYSLTLFSQYFDSLPQRNASILYTRFNYLLTSYF